MCIGANQGWGQFAGGTATLSGDRKGQERAQRDAKAITLVRCSKSRLRVMIEHSGWQKQGTTS